MTRPLAMPRTAAAQSALAQQVHAQSADYGVEEAICRVARDLNDKRGGGDLFWALAHVGAAYRNAPQPDRRPSLEERAEAGLSFGS